MNTYTISVDVTAPSAEQAHAAIGMMLRTDATMHTLCDLPPTSECRVIWESLRVEDGLYALTRLEEEALAAGRLVYRRGDGRLYRMALDKSVTYTIKRSDINQCTKRAARYIDECARKWNCSCKDAAARIIDMAAARFEKRKHGNTIMAYRILPRPASHQTRPQPSTEEQQAHEPRPGIGDHPEKRECHLPTP